ncbi:hypothetical protein AALP_AA8G381400 [Arabis alpina]|uniref:Uncharacterized protein n=1 Tax=Arabis alpina TaxID=50452 RepID=A0A087GC27_ARAAL|nr:hypothetical protein AALP_AA8G381400 [Arabis alpina]
MPRRKMPANYDLSILLHPDLLAKIAAYAADNRIEALTPYILSAPILKTAALSEVSLNRLCVDYRDDFASWSNTSSPYYFLYRKLVRAKNSYALYVESVKLAFNVGELDAAIYILENVTYIHPQARFMYIMLCFSAGKSCLKDELALKREFKFREIESLGREIITHIEAIQPRREDTYSDTWYSEDFPECWEEHHWLEEFNGKRCRICILW